MPRGQHDWRTRHITVQLQEGDDRTGKGDGANSHAKAHFNPADQMDNSVRPCDAKSLRAEKGTRSDKHRSEADQTVKSGDKLRHRRHRDLTCDDEPDNAANDNRAEDVDRKSTRLNYS